MIDFVQIVLAFVLVLAPLVFVHELGHFLAAKMFRIGVPVFSIGFGPRLFGFRRAETDYRVSAVPLGGYVRMHGDESDQNRTGAPDEFLARPKYQRFVVFVAGPLFNAITAFVALWIVFGVWGKDEIPTGYPVVVGAIESAALDTAVLQPNDKVIKIAGRDVRDPNEFFDVLLMEVQLAPDSTQPFVVERDGERLTVDVRIGSNPKDGSGDLGWELAYGGPAVIVEVIGGGAAEESGLQAGDTVLSVNGERPVDYIDFRLLLLASAGRPLALEVERPAAGEGATATEVVELTLTPREVNGQGKIAAKLSPSAPEHVDLSLVAAAGESMRTIGKLSRTLFVVLKRLLNRGIRSLTGVQVGPELPLTTLSGPQGIAKFARDALIAGARDFLFLLGFFSLQLGILNLLPIPVLDGGHILILGIESLMGRELSETVKERVMMVGFAMLIVLMSTVIVLDFLKP